MINKFKEFVNENIDSINYLDKLNSLLNIVSKNKNAFSKMKTKLLDEDFYILSCDGEIKNLHHQNGEWFLTFRELIKSEDHDYTDFDERNMEYEDISISLKELDDKCKWIKTKDMKELYEYLISLFQNLTNKLYKGLNK